MKFEFVSSSVVSCFQQYNKQTFPFYCKYICCTKKFSTILNIDSDDDDDVDDVDNRVKVCVLCCQQVRVYIVYINM